MFILDVSVGVSVRFNRRLVFCFFWRFLLYVVVVELELAGGASALSARHNCIWSVVLCPRRRPGRVRPLSARPTASDRVRLRPSAPDRARSPHRACLPHPAPAVRPPSCMPTRLSSLYSSDTSTQTLKILGSWMYALAYVNCESFSFPFLVGGRVSGRRRRDPAARSRLYLPMCKYLEITPKVR